MNNLIEIKCNTFVEFIDKIRNHTRQGFEVEQYNLPKYLLLGYVCNTTNQYWTCRFLPAKTEINDMPSNNKKMWFDLLKNAQLLLKYVNNKL
jgi:hypothetical protein